MATGDSLITQRVSTFKEPEFQAVREIVRGADAAFTNFETIIRNDRGSPRYKKDPTVWLSSPAFVLDELRWMGFDLFSLANNHSMDYGEGGLLETLRIFSDSGVVHAGTGRSLSEARAPAYLETEKGRIALVALNTGDEDGPAGEAWGVTPGRPGLNPLRFERRICLERRDFEQLESISKKLGLPRPDDGVLDFLGLRVEIAERADIHTAPYEPDVDGNLRSISEVRRNADYVLVSIHNHIKRRPGATYFDDTLEYIAGFVETFSRAAVDAGADAVLGTGTHCLNGIEVYGGRPIFYGLGNFISQSYRSIPMPYDWYEARGLIDKPHADMEKVRLHPRLSGEAEERRVRRLTTSVVAEVLFKGDRAEEVILYPIELSRQEIQGGRPLLAAGSTAEEILGRLSRLSAEYGTDIEIEDGRGRILL